VTIKMTTLYIFNFLKYGENKLKINFRKFVTKNSINKKEFT